MISRPSSHTAHATIRSPLTFPQRVRSGEVKVGDHWCEAPITALPTHQYLQTAVESASEGQGRQQAPRGGCGPGEDHCRHLRQADLWQDERRCDRRLRHGRKPHGPRADATHLRHQQVQREGRPAAILDDGKHGGPSRLARLPGASRQHRHARPSPGFMAVIVSVPVSARDICLDGTGPYCPHWPASAYPRSGQRCVPRSHTRDSGSPWATSFPPPSGCPVSRSNSQSRHARQTARRSPSQRPPEYHYPTGPPH